MIRSLQDGAGRRLVTLGRGIQGDVEAWSEEHNAPAERMQKVIIYTDGGCEPNPGVGGWGAVLLYGDTRKELSGGDVESTNNRMELTAAIEALEALKRPCQIELHTGLRVRQERHHFVVAGLEKGATGSARAARVKNQDLWQRLDEATERHSIDWNWVKGHAGVEENERCDQLAGEAIENIRKGKW